MNNMGGGVLCIVGTLACIALGSGIMTFVGLGMWSKGVDYTNDISTQTTFTIQNRYVISPQSYYQIEVDVATKYMNCSIIYGQPGQFPTWDLAQQELNKYTIGGSMSGYYTANDCQFNPIYQTTTVTWDPKSPWKIVFIVFVIIFGLFFGFLCFLYIHEKIKYGGKCPSLYWCCY
jgi:hypothetical protein